MQTNKTINVACVIISLSISLPSSLIGQKNQGTVVAQYKGQLGNQLFIFSLSKIISYELKIPLCIEPIPGFPHTYTYHAPLSINNFLPTECLEGHIINLKKILTDRSPRNILINGYFHRYEYYKRYKELIKHDWLIVEDPYELQNPHDIVLHIRTDYDFFYLPFEYYEKILSAVKYRQLYICTNNPNNAFLRHFDKYHPILYHQSPLEDFKFIMSFNKIISSQSTFCWWAAFLSNATEIYEPKPNHGYRSQERPDLNYIVDDEPRYHYIEINW